MNEKNKSSLAYFLENHMYCSQILARLGTVKEQATGTSIGETGGKRESESGLSNKKKKKKLR